MGQYGLAWWVKVAKSRKDTFSFVPSSNKSTQNNCQSTFMFGLLGSLTVRNDNLQLWRKDCTWVYIEGYLFRIYAGQSREHSRVPLCNSKHPTLRKVGNWLTRTMYVLWTTELLGAPQEWFTKRSPKPIRNCHSNFLMMGPNRKYHLNFGNLYCLVVLGKFSHMHGSAFFYTLP